jgi:hypothetical protein
MHEKAAAGDLLGEAGGAGLDEGVDPFDRLCMPSPRLENAGAAVCIRLAGVQKIVATEV